MTVQKRERNMEPPQVTMLCGIAEEGNRQVVIGRLEALPTPPKARLWKPFVIRQFWGEEVACF
ncbi:hypothetical protein AAJCM20276_29280 [Acetobacter aceti]|uniref:Uncharacterized protein n=1 Tax=Acetobacter aceti TaxID=435 RepID=A0A6S6PT81_ACEAC|nr:hypothetical protein AAJCM20276_29280 [Acetobacter aceti]